MTNVLFLEPEMLDKLRNHLLSGDGEQVAFIFAEATSTEESGVWLSALELHLCTADDYDSSAFDHISLTDEAQQSIVKRAWDRRVALVELHSHPESLAPACFSPFDARGLSEFAPHVRWRLKGQPYAALVFGPSDFDSLVWRTTGKGPELLYLDLGARLSPTGRTLAVPQLAALLESSNDV